jgi:hypothetical protein
MLEGVQMKKSISAYFASIWNYFDIMVIVILGLTIILDMLDIDSKV